jgi:predicted ArsR family transcriptional regulator
VDGLAHSGQSTSQSTSELTTQSTNRDHPLLTDGEFSAAVVAVTSAFGDPNVARHHLDKLAAGGYLDVFVDRTHQGGAGRPSKRYRVSGLAAGLETPLKGDDLLITLLGRALALVPVEQAEAMAEEVGEQYGRQLAGQMGTGPGQRSFRAALHAVADALTAHAEARGSSLALIKEACPFFDAAKQHPVICAVDRGMVRGMLGSLYGKTVTATESSRALGDEACVTFV